MDILPSLKAIRAFEVAGRKKSLTLAAGELNVTRPAISKQISILEAELGQQLFFRSRNGLEFTPSGQALHESVRQAFLLLSSACRNVRRSSEISVLDIVVDRDFATTWLSYNLHHFFASSRDVSINLRAEPNTVAKTSDDCDIRIFYDRREQVEKQGDQAPHILLDWLDVPLCSPNYAATVQNNTSSDWNSLKLLHDHEHDLWEQWLSAAGIKRVPQPSDPFFNSTSHCLISASSGLGVALGDTFTAHSYLMDGQLVCPFPVAMKSSEVYVMEVTSRGRSKKASIDLFGGWLHQALAKLTEDLQSIVSQWDLKTVD